MTKMCEIKHALIDKVYDKIEHLDTVCTEELGEVIDMIKDIEEAHYYKTIVDAMNEKAEEEE